MLVLVVCGVGVVPAPLAPVVAPMGLPGVLAVPLARVLARLRPETSARRGGTGKQSGPVPVEALTVSRAGGSS